MKIMIPYEQKIRSREIEQVYEWDKWIRTIPAIRFHADWDVRIIPPFGGAVVRFVVANEEYDVSVFLDCYEVLGATEEPYWEIYPDEEGDACRFLMDDTAGLMNGIKRSLEHRREPK
jgi:hypothetical protein